MAEVLLHKETSQSVLKALLYYDIFKYPLTSKEVFHSLSTNHVTHEDVHKALNDLSIHGYVFKQHDFYSVRSDQELIDRRVRGNTEAQRWMGIAAKQARLIHSFPFVKAVMVSGSLSKNYMDEKSDLDFFIITSPQRLWIARTLLVGYKKILLLNSHKFFCVNYFIDSDHLEIEEKNIFTATELVTLLPMCGNEYYKELFQNNKWLYEFLPNHPLRSPGNDHYSQSRFKNVAEGLINFLGGNWWDTLLMNLTRRRWKRTYSHKYNSEDFSVAFKTTKHASKNHPRFYQKKVVNQYTEKLTQFASKFSIKWIHE